MIRVAVLEDEKSCADTLIEYLHRFEREQNRGGLFDIRHFPSGLDFLDTYQADFDIIFLDIQMPHLDGMQTAQQIYRQDKTAILIFVTNLRQYAVRGYEVNAMGYLLKPVAYDSIADRLEKALQRVSLRPRKRMILLYENAATQVELSDILYVEVSGHVLTYHTLHGTYQVRGKLSDCEADLTEHGFSRCNKCYLVNLLHVKSIDAAFAKVGGDALAISRGRAKPFMADFLMYLRKGGAVG